MIVSGCASRSELRRFVGDRIELRAKITDFGTVRGHPPFFALRKDVRFQDGQVAADHVWTVWNGAMFKANVGVGDEIAMFAQIIEYQRRDGSTDFGIDRVGKVRLVLKPRSGTKISVMATPSQLLAERTARREPVIRNTDQPQLQMAMLSQFDANSALYGHEIRVEFGPAVALFMLNGAAKARGLGLVQYANSLSADGNGKTLLNLHVQRLERSIGAKPLIVLLRGVPERELALEAEAEADVRAGRNVIRPTDDDEAAYYKMRWLRSSEQTLELLIVSRHKVSILAAGVLGAMAAWTDGKHPDPKGQIARVLRSAGPVLDEQRPALARKLTATLATWMRDQRRHRAK